MTEERDPGLDLPGAAPLVEGRRWLWITLGVWAAALLLLAWAAWGAAWLLANTRVSFEMPSAPEASRSETLPSHPVPPEPSPAPAPYMSDEGRAITDPAWLRAPQPEFPRAALEAGADGGTVRLICQTDEKGRVRACRVAEETPPGVGFGAQAVKAAMRARVRPRLVDGEPTESEVAFTVRYRLH
ncbi:energy transducer TonB [Brevundimonas sp.]|uniref:energy transducer TonB n=1 Tax=Brevundimonas sp. TaxID=1871086 RepID=UPI003D6D3B4C